MTSCLRYETSRLPGTLRSLIFPISVSLVMFASYLMSFTDIHIRSDDLCRTPERSDRALTKVLVTILNQLVTRLLGTLQSFIPFFAIEYEIIGEGSQISTNQKPGNSAFSLLIG